MNSWGTVRKKSRRDQWSTKTVAHTKTVPLKKKNRRVGDEFLDLLGLTFPFIFTVFTLPLGCSSICTNRHLDLSYIPWVLGLGRRFFQHGNDDGKGHGHGRPWRFLGGVDVLMAWWIAYVAVGLELLSRRSIFDEIWTDMYLLVFTYENDTIISDHYTMQINSSWYEQHSDGY